jgi:hypothetical protein
MTANSFCGEKYEKEEKEKRENIYIYKKGMMRKDEWKI